jgi:predicted dinucleotide-binding enzyme
MSTIGILGTGRMGVRLALLFADLGHQVVLGSRDRERATQILHKLNRGDIQSGSYQEGVSADVVLPAMFLRDGSLDTLEAFRNELDGYFPLMNYKLLGEPWSVGQADRVAAAISRGAPAAIAVF